MVRIAFLQMRVVFLVILIFFSLQSLSQDSGFDKVDKYVDGLKLNANMSLDNLVTTLTKPFTSPTLKTRAIYYWIAKNIQYDHEGLRTGYWKKYHSEQSMVVDTYKLRKGICSGYSCLFKYMVNKAKIDCEVVNGYLRYDLQTVIIDSVNHTWNVAKLDNKWYLFDVTGAASDTLTNEVVDFWFMTHPEIFILNHYPENTNWTLLEKTIGLKDFMNAPVYTSSFITMSLVSNYHTKGYYEAVDNVVTIELKTTKNYMWLTKLYDLDKGEWFASKNVEDRAFEKGYIKLSIDRRGKFILKLDAATNNDRGFTIYQDLVYYIVENN
jgi:transglutaminase/protease-like cytokinesis protein 3